MHRRRNPRRIPVARHRAAQRGQLRRPAPLEVDKKTRLGSGREPVDRANDLRRFVGWERNPSRSRHVDYFLNRTLQKSAAKRSITQRSDGSSRESACSGKSGDEDKLLPQIHLDLIRRAGIDARIAESGNDASYALGAPVVHLTDDYALERPATLDDPRLHPRHTDPRHASEYCRRRYSEGDQSLRGLDAIQERQNGRARLCDALHHRRDRIERIALDREDREIGGAKLLDTIGGFELHHGRALRRADFQTALKKRCEVVSTRVESDVVSGARQLSAVIRADCADAEDNNFHEWLGLDCPIERILLPPKLGGRMRRRVSLQCSGASNTIRAQDLVSALPGVRGPIAA